MRLFAFEAVCVCPISLLSAMLPLLCPCVCMHHHHHHRRYNYLLYVPYQLERIMVFGTMLCFYSFLVR